MYGTNSSISSLLGAYHMSSVSMRYSRFMPRVYNLAKSLGFKPGKIMPSRAFCSDESQGYPIILIAKHFGTFPFNHGLVGGIVATDRHAPHAHHGKDLVIIQASHVGYDPVNERFGVYRRLQTGDACETSNCGKIGGALEWYIHEYEFACQNIFLTRENDDIKVIIDNLLLHADREEGLLLNLEKIVKVDAQGKPTPELSKSTAKVFPASTALLDYYNTDNLKDGQIEPIGNQLHPDLFYFKRSISLHHEGRDHLEKNLINVMPYVVTSKWPSLTAAQANTQVEFDRAFRTIIQEPTYKNKKILFISGLNVDISPQEGQVFPLTKFIPWAAYVQDEQGNHHTWEQAELFEKLMEQSTENPDQLDLETAIEIMESAQEIYLPF
ncbi:MAG: hypothetical protein KZQ57_10480 [gamma proteobacterium symbiont of Lucinoma myriamae]|nr:hypothetical protein [gamma proteobacterium symbiont of Lucinoma myriamae]